MSFPRPVPAPSWAIAGVDASASRPELLPSGLKAPPPPRGIPGSPGFVPGLFPAVLTEGPSPAPSSSGWPWPSHIGSGFEGLTPRFALPPALAARTEMKGKSSEREEGSRGARPPQACSGHQCGHGRPATEEAGFLCHQQMQIAGTTPLGGDLSRAFLNPLAFLLPSWGCRGPFPGVFQALCWWFWAVVQGRERRRLWPRALGLVFDGEGPVCAVWEGMGSPLGEAPAGVLTGVKG